MQDSKQNPKLSEEEFYCLLLDQANKQNKKLTHLLEDIRKIILEVNQVQKSWAKIEKTIRKQTGL